MYRKRILSLTAEVQLSHRGSAQNIITHRGFLSQIHLSELIRVKELY